MQLPLFVVEGTTPEPIQSGIDVELAECAHDAHRDLAAVGHQHPTDRSGLAHRCTLQVHRELTFDPRARWASLTPLAFGSLTSTLY